MYVESAYTPWYNLDYLNQPDIRNDLNVICFNKTENEVICTALCS